MNREKSLTKIFLYIISAVLLVIICLPLTTMYKRNEAITILEYHNIGEGIDTNQGPWTVSKNDFQEQMAYLANNCHVIPLKTLLGMIKQGKTVPANTIAITFDDGYRSNYLLAYPVLAKYRLPATIFVIGKYIETGMVGDSPALTWDEMKTMYDSGLIDIQSHTYDLHTSAPSGPSGKQAPAALARLANAQGFETRDEQDVRVENDLVKAKQLIEQKVGGRVNVLSWPFGAYGRHEIDLAQKAGYYYMIGIARYSNPRTSMDDIGRVAVSGGISLNDFKELVHPRKVTYFQAVGMDWQRLKDYIRLFINRC